MANKIFNRPFHSQTDLFGTKILTPQFFLENILALCPKVGGSENFPPLDPLGPQNPYLGVRPPKTEKLHILQGKIVYLLADHFHCPQPLGIGRVCFQEKIGGSKFLSQKGLSDSEMVC